MNTRNAAPVTPDTRLWFLDRLRIFAAFAVVFLHTSPFNQPYVPVASGAWRVLNLICTPFRWAVPIFFMMSGALFLSGKRAFSIKRLYQKNLLRLLTSFLFWSAVYALAYCVTTGKGKWTFANQLLRGHYHMWYLFAIAGLYIVTPLLRRVTESKKATEYLLASGFLLAFLIPRALAFLQLFPLPHADVLSSLQSAFAQTNPYRGLSALYYYVLGHYLAEYTLDKRVQRIAALAGIAGLIATVGLTGWHSARIEAVSSQFYDHSALCVLTMSAALFLLFKRRFSAAPAKGRRRNALLLLSACSYGVYLVHPFFIERLNLSFSLSPLLLLVTVPLASLMIYLLSLTLSLLLGRIPVLNKYIV